MDGTQELTKVHIDLGDNPDSGGEGMWVATSQSMSSRKAARSMYWRALRSGAKRDWSIATEPARPVPT